MFRFAAPEYFYFLLFIPLCLLLYVGSSIWMRKRWKRLGNVRILRSLVADYSSRRFGFKMAMLVFALVALVFALSRPQWGTTQSSSTKSGIALSVMLDVSNSMLAQDTRPSRLQRAKFLLNNLLDKLENHKVAVGIFAGEAYPQVPLTHDVASAKMLVETLTPNMVTCQGTSTASAIRLAMRSFDKQDKSGRVVLLITDGEDHEEGALQAAEELRNEGIQLIVVGVGSTSGAAIPLSSGGVLLDEEGRPVKTALNEDACKEIAEKADGVYFHIDQGGDVINLLINHIETMQYNSYTTTFTEQNEQFQAFLLIALLVVLIEFIIFERRSRLSRRMFHLILFPLLLSPISTHAQDAVWSEMHKGVHRFNQTDYKNARRHFSNALAMDSTNSGTHFNLGNALLAEGQPDSALYHYKVAATTTADKMLTADAFHNMGYIHQRMAGFNKSNTALHDSLLRAAITCYADALRRVPTADDTRYNMVLCMKQLKDSQQQQQQQEQQQQKQNEQQQNDSTQQQAKEPKKQEDKQRQNKNNQQLLNYAKNAEQRTKQKINQQPIRKYKVKYW